jgi:UDP-glucose:glycoprotein glucosyltransferase
MKAAVRIRALVWVASILAAFTVLVLADTSPPVQVQLRSPWPAAPLLLEILEAAHEEDPSSFFPLLTHLTDASIAKESEASDKAVLEAARKVLREAQLLKQRGQRENFELHLALRSQSPKVAAFWQLYDTNGLQQRWQEASEGKLCDSWVDFAGKVICSEEELLKAWESYDGGIFL